MSEPNDDPANATARAGAFDTTQWSVVVQAGAEGSGEAVAALEKLCRTYWPPLYAYVRRQGYAPHDAQDLVQEFFARFLEHQYVRLVTPARGRFRSFLLTSLKHFLINEWKQANRQKRGGGRQIISLDEELAEQRFAAEPLVEQAPDALFDQRWAATMLEQALGRLRAEVAQSGRAEAFDQLKTFIWGAKEAETYATPALRLGMSEGALKVTVCRLRRRFGELLRDEVSGTVATAGEVEAELRYLITVVRC